MVSYSTRRKTTKAQRRAEILKRLKVCREQVDNLQCADCGDAKPAWASLLKPPPKQYHQAGTTNKKLGIFCCYKCCNYHFQMGRDICEVKNIKSADDWTEEEVKTMEASGNAISNAIYEGLLSSGESQEQKPNPANHDAQAKFVKEKYKKLTFFCKRTYQVHGSWFVAYQQNEKASKKNSKRSSSIYPQMGAVPHTPLSLTAQFKAHAQQKQQQKQSPFPTLKPGQKDAEEVPIANVSFLSGDAVDYGDIDQEDNPDSRNDSVDLGYGEASPDSGYGQEADYDYESCDDDDEGMNESLQAELARRSMIGGGYIRRGSNDGSRESLGRRRGSNVGGRRESLGRRGSATGMGGGGGRRATAGAPSGSCPMTRRTKSFQDHHPTAESTNNKNYRWEKQEDYVAKAASPPRKPMRDSLRRVKSLDSKTLRNTERGLPDYDWSKGCRSKGRESNSSRSPRRDPNASMRRRSNDGSVRRCSNDGSVRRRPNASMRSDSNASLRRGSNASARSPGRRTTRRQPDGSPISRRPSTRRSTMSLLGECPTQRPSVPRTHSCDDGMMASRRDSLASRRESLASRRESLASSRESNLRPDANEEWKSSRRSVQRMSSQQSIGSRVSTRSSSGNDTCSDYSDASIDDDISVD